jgi:hypothetical protein
VRHLCIPDGERLCVRDSVFVGLFVCVRACVRVCVRVCVCVCVRGKGAVHPQPSGLAWQIDIVVEVQQQALQTEHPRASSPRSYHCLDLLKRIRNTVPNADKRAVAIFLHKLDHDRWVCKVSKLSDAHFNKGTGIERTHQSAWMCPLPKRR